jgi:hypothetical protein
MPVDFLSDTQWEVLIYSPQSQNGGVSQGNCMHNSVGLHDSFYHGHIYDIGDPHDTEMNCTWRKHV